MIEVMQLVLSLLAGILLGAVFFGGLWWTVKKAIGSKRRVAWFTASLLLRTTFAVAGFYLVSGGSWKRLLACLAGFVVARTVVGRLVARSMLKEASDAP